jgi:hypothetical protein
MSARDRILIAAVVVAASLSTVAAAASVDPTGATADRAAVRMDPPAPAVVIGDSAIAALRWVPGADNAVAGFDHTLDLESCRRLFATSCSGREGRRPPTAYEALAEHGDKYQILVIATGYNDGTSIFEDTFVLIVERARRLGYEQIVWWTLRSDVDYVSPGSVGNHVTFEANNQVVRDLLATGDYPDVVLADWDRYTSELPQWFVTDGVHYRAVGAWGAADYLSRKMAFLEGRRCPVPVAPGARTQNPCPDPDVTGPVADIEALYPVGEDGVLCYELGEERRIECRSDTHVIQIRRELSPGTSGEDVAALQTRLIRLGRLSGGADGQFGPLTQGAVAAFQSSEGLPADGVADGATLAALGFDVSAIRR